MGKPENTVQSIMQRVKVAENGCWEWQGALDAGGYGQLRYKGTHYRAHRLFYTLLKGPIEKGLMACHTCDNRKCVNPEHIFIGTNQDNLNDMKLKGRARNQYTGPLPK